MRKLIRSNSTIPRIRDRIGPICLRRPKDIIDLPSRNDEIHKVEFQIEEALRYNRANELITASLDPGLDGTHLNAYANILTKINSLRQICNLGLLHRDTNCARQGHKDPAIRAQELFDAKLSAGVAVCSMCRRDLTQSNVSNESLLGVKEGRNDPQPRVALCGHLICASCSGRLDSLAIEISPKCKHRPSCQFFVVETDSSTLMDTSLSTLELPSKVSALRNDLLAVPETEKR